MPLLALGGKGVISVLSNVARSTPMTSAPNGLPVRLPRACPCSSSGAAYQALFADVNPIPVKWAMNRLGWNAGDCRLPLVAPSAAVQAQLETAMQEFGLLK